MDYSTGHILEWKCYSVFVLCETGMRWMSFGHAT